MAGPDHSDLRWLDELAAAGDGPPWHTIAALERWDPVVGPPCPATALPPPHGLETSAPALKRARPPDVVEEAAVAVAVARVPAQPGNPPPSSSSSSSSSPSSSGASPGPAKKRRARETAASYDRSRRKRLGELIEELGRLTGTAGSTHVAVLEAASATVRKVAMRTPVPAPVALSVQQLLSAELCQPIVTLDVHGTAVACNSAYSRTFGYPRELVASRCTSLRQFMTPEALPAGTTFFGLAASGVMRRGWGACQWVSMSGRPRCVSCCVDVLKDGNDPDKTTIVVFLTPSSADGLNNAKPHVQIEMASSGMTISAPLDRRGAEAMSAMQLQPLMAPASSSASASSLSASSSTSSD